jgi:hypothetical protein
MSMQQQVLAIGLLTALLESDGGALAREQADAVLRDRAGVRDLVYGLQGVAFRLLIECAERTGESEEAVLQRLAIAPMGRQAGHR